MPEFRYLPCSWGEAIFRDEEGHAKVLVRLPDGQIEAWAATPAKARLIEHHNYDLVRVVRPALYLEKAS